MRRWVIASCTLFLLAWTARFAWLRITVRPTPRPDYWEAKLAALDPPPPGALSFAQIEPLLTSRPWETGAILSALADFEVGSLLQGRWTLWRKDIAAGMLVFVTPEFLKARQRLLEATAVGWHEPMNLTSPDFARLGACRMWGSWLLAHGRSAWIAGRPDVAFEDWMAVLRLARQARRGQTVISHAVESSLQAEVADELMLALQEGEGSLDSLQLADKMAEILGPELTPRQRLAGERIASQCDLESVFVRRGRGWLDVSEMVRMRSASFGIWPPPAGGTSRVWNLASPLFHGFEEASQKMERLYTEAERCTHLSVCEAIQRRLAADPALKPGILDGQPDVGYGSLDTVLVGVSQMAYLARTRLEAALAMHALAAYQRDRGEYPETLGALVPSYLPALPIDYADRAPLRYRRADQRYVLYSIGPDGHDHNGVGDAVFDHHILQGRDIVFSAIRREEPEPVYSGPGMLRKP
ncbi:MAG: hypothetical protein AMXMBFR13_45210 [Phycisphaerae bacterium]